MTTELPNDPVVAALAAWFDRPDVRIVRSLKRDFKGEWVTASDLVVQLAVPNAKLATYEVAIDGLVVSGHVELRRDGGPMYRHLKDLPAPGAAGADGGLQAAPVGEGFEGEEREGYFFWRGSWRPS